MATIKVAYASVTAITCAVATTPLASSSTFIVGRQSTVIDNTSNLYDDVLVSGKITVGTTPTINTQIQIYIYGLDNTPNYPDTFDGTDADKSITSAGVRDGMLKLGAILNVDTTTSNRTYYIAPFSVAQLFGGVVPPYWGVYVSHNTGVALNSTGSNHALRFNGITYVVN